ARDRGRSLIVMVVGAGLPPPYAPWTTVVIPGLPMLVVQAHKGRGAKNFPPSAVSAKSAYKALGRVSGLGQRSPRRRLALAGLRFYASLGVLRDPIARQAS